MQTSRAVVAALLVGVLASACAVDTYEVAYDDVFAARAEDAVDRGWVPEWLPEGSTDIRATFDPGDGTSALVATLGTDRASLDDACSSTSDLPEEPGVTTDGFPDEVTTAGGVLACDDNRYVVVADGRVFTWTPPGVHPIEPE